MKDRLRLAQSIFMQLIEKMGVFGPFSRLSKVDFQRREKPDSAAVFGFGAGCIFTGAQRVPRTLPSRADLSILDVKDLGAGADLGEGGRVRAGQPDLRAELAQLLEQRRAAVWIEMSDDL